MLLLCNCRAVAAAALALPLAPLPLLGLVGVLGCVPFGRLLGGVCVYVVCAEVGWSSFAFGTEPLGRGGRLAFECVGVCGEATLRPDQAWCLVRSSLVHAQVPRDWGVYGDPVVGE